MSILDIFRINSIKANLDKCQQENAELKKVLNETERMTIVEIKQEIERLREQQRQVEQEANKNISQLSSQRQDIEKSLYEIKAQIDEGKRNLVILEDELLLQSFGFYKTKYALNNSEAYKFKLEEIRGKQAAMVKNDKAATCSTNWTLSGSAKEGERMVADYLKLILRSFNNECDASIINVKFNNVESIEKKITKAYETLNRLGKRMQIEISSEYYRLKVQELFLCYEYQVKKQEEKEEQKRLREQMREEAKVMKEIEEARLRIEKEEKHFCQAVIKLNAQIAQAKTEEEKLILLDKRAELEGKLAAIEKDKINILNREQNTRAGYVYIISNIGAFGSNVYKIGVTRRLDPSERVDELGDASVPFDFDIHALIFSDDAPKLETSLHRAFENRRLNLINNRREFFQVSLDEIEEEVKKNHNKTVEFNRLADAIEYRESMVLRENRGKLN